jgi:hypothetical protein
VRYLAIVAAVVLLVAIGTIEAGESARQLADQPGRGSPTLAPGGAALTFFGLVLSLAVYGVLGWIVARDRGTERIAVWIGVVVGIFAGVIGGSIRALFVRDYLANTLGRYGLPEELTSWSLVVFVLLSVAASAAGGGAITWLSFRRARPARPRPRS